MTGPKRMRPESAEADSELAISYVVEPERRMSEQVPRWPQADVQHAATGIAGLASASWAARSTPSTTATWWRPQKCRGCTTSTK